MMMRMIIDNHIDGDDDHLNHHYIDSGDDADKPPVVEAPPTQCPHSFHCHCGFPCGKTSSCIP